MCGTGSVSPQETIPFWYVTHTIIAADETKGESLGTGRPIFASPTDCHWCFDLDFRLLLDIMFIL